MASKRRKKAVDIVDTVLASLPHSVDIPSLKQQIEEQLRLLNVRAPGKQLGKGDSMESRKLVLLELILRSEKVRLPLGKLASAVGMKAAAFEGLSTKVENYVEIAQMTQPQSSRSSLASVTSTVSSTIPALSIRLGSQVHDSHGFCSRAQQLLEDIEQHIQSSSTLSNQKKKGYLQDMQRSRAAYEAACFYVVAQMRVEYADMQLSIQNIVDASSLSASAIRDVLPTVEKFASIAQKEDRQTKEPAPASRKRGRSRISSQQGTSKRSNAHLSFLDGIDEMRATGETNLPKNLAEKPPTFVYSAEFSESKKRVLEQVLEETKRVMKEESSETSISNFDVLERAADEVLKRNGLLK
jgi:hypothetical protein